MQMSRLCGDSTCELGRPAGQMVPSPVFVQASEMWVPGVQVEDQGTKATQSFKAPHTTLA